MQIPAVKRRQAPSSAVIDIDPLLALMYISDVIMYNNEQLPSISELLPTLSEQLLSN